MAIANVQAIAAGHSFIILLKDGYTPKGVETKADIQARKNLLRQFGYKL